MAKNEVVKDSGSMQEYSSGAHRDNATGKGRCDLLPLGYVSLVLNKDPVLANIDIFMERRDIVHLADALQCAIDTLPVFCWDEIFAEMQAQGIEMRKPESGRELAQACMAHMMIEVSKLYEAGAQKYQPNNWQLGMPVNRYIDSGVRHYLKTLRGDIDEAHYRGFVWNLLCAMWTAENLPELNYKDEPKRPEKQENN